MTAHDSRYAASLSAGLAVCLVLLSPTLGCKKKKPGLSDAEATRAAQLKPEAAKRLSQMAALGPKAKSLLQTSTDEPVAKKLPSGSYALIGEEYLADPTATRTGELELGDSRVWLCKSAVDSTALTPDDLPSLEACTRFEYAAVIRKGTYVAPEIGDSNYRPGEFRGDLLVFHLPSGELRGRYALSAKNEENIQTQKGAAKFEVEKLAMKELASNVKAAAADKLMNE